MPESCSPPSAELPDPHRRWVDELLEAPVPAETAATCASCAMCASPGEDRTRRATFFDPRVKCCSYVPELPNFLVGRVLLDADPALDDGRRTVRRRIAGRAGVTPLGLGRSATQDALYGHVTGAGGFGRSTAVRCPHYRAEGGGSCTIWRHRNSVCSTWHCKHDRGARGRDFWHALEELLGRVETELAYWCLDRLGLDPDGLARLLTAKGVREHALDDGTREGSEADRRYCELWGVWAGREEELFASCARLVESLAWEQVLAICGPRVRIAAGALRNRHRALLDTAIPERLRLAPYRVLHADGDALEITTYSPDDPLRLPRMLIEALAAFDGRPTVEAVASIASERGLRLSDALLGKLVDFELLVAD